MGLTKIGPKHQITIPKAVFERLDLEVGDYLEVEVQSTMITMAPKKLISKVRCSPHEATSSCCELRNPSGSS